MPKDLCFLDCETTGLDPTTHEIIDIAAIRVSHDLQELKRVQCFVSPQFPERASPEAAALTGFSPARWRALDPVPLAEALDRITPCVEGAELIGQFVRFDEQFLRAAFSSSQRKPCWSSITHDLITLALPFSAALPNRRLPTLCAAFGVSLVSPHRALCDVSAALEIARKLIPAYRALSASLLDPRAVSALSSPP